MIVDFMTRRVITAQAAWDKRALGCIDLLTIRRPCIHCGGCNRNHKERIQRKAFREAQ